MNAALFAQAQASYEKFRALVAAAEAAPDAPTRDMIMQRARAAEMAGAAAWNAAVTEGRKP